MRRIIDAESLAIAAENQAREAYFRATKAESLANAAETQARKAQSQAAAAESRAIAAETQAREAESRANELFAREAASIQLQDALDRASFDAPKSSNIDTISRWPFCDATISGV